jgi:predicted glycosyltransferase
MSNILIDVSHPAHVHLFRNAAYRWRAQGHNILFSALDREMILYLLDLYDLPYRVVYKRRSGKPALILELLLRSFPTLYIARQFKTDLFVSGGNPTVGFPAWLMRKPYLALTDTEHSVLQRRLYKPFATLIATPDVFSLDLGEKQVRYAGFHELAYLHPDEFTPDAHELEALGLTPSDTYFVVRFVAWGASHDIGEHGFSADDKREVLRELSQHGRVLLSVESGEIDPEFYSLATTFPPEKIHHLLAFASLYIGEGGTMLTEAALLGTPALFVSTLRAGNWDHLRDNYGLLYFFNTGREALAKAREILAMPNLKLEWKDRRARLLADKINPTPWLVELGNRLLENANYKVEE